MGQTRVYGAAGKMLHPCSGVGFRAGARALAHAMGERASEWAGSKLYFRETRKFSCCESFFSVTVVIFPF
jgi:hypothetical protein